MRQKSVYSLNTAWHTHPVMSTTDRLVLVPAAHLDELLELARLAAARLPETDPLTLALKGSVAQLRSEAVLDPN